jgi:hypothetical protein
MNTFFQGTDGVKDRLYRDIRSAPNPHLQKAQRLTECMWASCAQFVDDNARERAKKDDFYAVWWELYVAYALSSSGISLVPTKDRRPSAGKGRPDLLTSNPRIWIEAVMPHPGTGPDALSEPPMDGVYSVPTEAYVLRLRTAIEEKVFKLDQYRKEGTIQSGDATIIAVSGARLPFRFSEPPIPRIVRAICAVGCPVLEIDLATRERLGTTVEFRDHILKKSNASVRTDLFTQRQSAHVSAVLYSASDCVNHPQKPGADFILVHNPNAMVPIAENWLPVGDQYWIENDVLRRVCVSDGR